MISLRASAIEVAGARGEDARRTWRVCTVAVIALGAVVAAGVQHASHRYRLALEVQKYYTCLPFDAYLVDTCDQYTIEGEAFTAAVRGERPVPVPLETARGNMLTIDAVFQSARENRWVALANESVSHTN